MKNRSSCRTDAIERFALAQAVMPSLHSNDTYPDTSAAKDSLGNQYQQFGCYTIYGGNKDDVIDDGAGNDTHWRRAA